MELLLPTCVAAATVSPLCSPVTTSYLFFSSNADSLLFLLKWLLSYFVLVGLCICDIELGRKTDKSPKARKMGRQQNRA